MYVPKLHYCTIAVNNHLKYGSYKSCVFLSVFQNNVFYMKYYKSSLKSHERMMKVKESVKMEKQKR